MAVEFHLFDNAVGLDVSMPAPAHRLYNYLLAMSNIKNGETFPMYIGEIAQKFETSERYVQKWLKCLIDRGYVVRVFRKDNRKPKWNLSSYFIITYIRDTKLSDDKSFNVSKKNGSPGSISQVHRKRVLESLKENQNLTLKRGEDPDGEPKAPVTSESSSVDSSLPEDAAIVCERIMKVLEANEANSEVKEPVKPEKPVDKASKYDLSGVPEAMRNVAEYLLYKTGRPALTQREREILREILDAQHTPTRVMKEIAKQVAIKQRRGLNVRQVTFNLIGHILRNQYSHEQAQIRHAANKEVAKARKAALQAEAQVSMPKVAAPVLPVEEAERIIAEYVPVEQAKKADNIPVALKELYESIQKRSDELNCTEFDPEVFTTEEYLRLKFPEAKERELSRSYSCSDRDIEKTFKHDFKCATCTDPETCPFKNMSGRPALVLREYFGRFEVSSAWTLSSGCKHQWTQKADSAPNPELEQRIKNSGLSEIQSKQTFESYNHAGAKPEVISAKAKAILAAKNKTSLVLAGKPGTGKTHLAISIALEAMKGGQNAIFTTMPDMLEELARVDWEHKGIFYAVQKYREVPCLVLDDFDKAKLTPKKIEYLFQIINYRYSRGLQTIVTTNAYDMSGLVDEVNAKAIEPIISRLLNRGEWVTLQEAENYRL